MIHSPHAWVGRNGTLYLHMWIARKRRFRSGARSSSAASMRLQSATRGSARWTATRNTFNIAPGWNPIWYSQVGQPVALVKR
jgi:hypothetical protein